MTAHNPQKPPFHLPQQRCCPFNKRGASCRKEQRRRRKSGFARSVRALEWKRGRLAAGESRRGGAYLNSAPPPPPLRWEKGLFPPLPPPPQPSHADHGLVGQRQRLGVGCSAEREPRTGLEGHRSSSSSSSRRREEPRRQRRALEQPSSRAGSGLLQQPGGVLFAVLPGHGRRLLLRVRPASPKYLLGIAAWAPLSVAPPADLGSLTARAPAAGAARRRAAESSERPDAGKAEQSKGFAELYENPWTVPNLLSMARIGLAPILGYLIIEENFNVALGVFALAGITDLLDGFIALNWDNQKSVLGSALDPLADKILISILYISLTCANLIPVPLTSMIILRDIVLIAAVFYVRYKTLPPPVNTVVQLILVAASLAAPVFNYVDSVYLQTLWCITAFTTTASAYSYYHYGRKTVQVLNDK